MWASTLTAAERTAWNHFGLITPSTNVYGQTTYLSGHQWFCKCSINLLIAGLAVNTGAPATATVPGPTSLSVVATHTGVDSLALTYADAGAPASCYINLRVSQPISRGISYCNNEFRTLEIRGNPGSPYNPVALYLTRFPEFIYSIGRKIFVLLAYMDGATGIMSPAVIADAIIT